MSISWSTLLSVFALSVRQNHVARMRASHSFGSHRLPFGSPSAAV